MCVFRKSTRGPWSGKSVHVPGIFVGQIILHCGHGVGDPTARHSFLVDYFEVHGIGLSLRSHEKTVRTSAQTLKLIV